MAEMKLDLSGPRGIAALVGVVAIVALRAATLGATDDPALHAAIRAHLQNDLGNNLGQALEATDTGNADDVAALLERADASNITLHEVAVSKPLLSFGSNTEAVVHCAYTLPGAARAEAYWRFRDQAVGGWRYRGASSVVSYYLNFF